MGRNLQDFFQWRADLLQAGRCAELSEQYAFPFTLHLEDGTTLVVEERQHLIEMFEKWRLAWKSRGVSHTKVEVTKTDEMPRGRYRIWTTVREYGVTGLVLGEKSYVQYGRRTVKGFCTEVLEVTRHSAAQTWPQAEVAATTGSAG